MLMLIADVDADADADDVHPLYQKTKNALNDVNRKYSYCLYIPYATTDTYFRF